MNWWIGHMADSRPNWFAHRYFWNWLLVRHRFQSVFQIGFLNMHTWTRFGIAYMKHKHRRGAVCLSCVSVCSYLRVILAPRQNLPRIILKGIFQGVKVVRGPDWDWGNQDGEWCVGSVGWRGGEGGGLFLTANLVLPTQQAPPPPLSPLGPFFSTIMPTCSS